jgi:hypothetical protein
MIKSGRPSFDHGALIRVFSFSNFEAALDRAYRDQSTCANFIVNDQYK